MSVKRICYDRILPSELNRPMRMMMIGGRLEAVLEFRKLWINGSVLSVRFMEGTDDQRDQVMQQAKLWTEHANLTFEFGDKPDADIRITFDDDDGAWSYMGTDAKNIPQDQATMNLGFLEGGTAIHEFGHAIGLGHEHQNPDGGIEWNEDEVISDLSGPPNNWTESQIRHNVLDRYSRDQIRGTKYDEDSIMLYGFPRSWTVDGSGTRRNSTLSDTDMSFIRSAEAYPGVADPQPEAVQIGVIDTSGVEAEIGAPGEEDLFTFDVDTEGRHVLETSGGTDVVMKLFGPDSQTSLVAEDDDGGVGRNSRIAAFLSTGQYFIQIRHFNQSAATGKYRVSVTR